MSFLTDRFGDSKTLYQEVGFSAQHVVNRIRISCMMILPNPLQNKTLDRLGHTDKYLEKNG
jgi:hypothetical protein